MKNVQYSSLVHLLSRISIIAVHRNMDDEAERILRYVRQRVVHRSSLEASVALALSLRGDQNSANILLNQLKSDFPDDEMIAVSMGVVAKHANQDEWRSHFETILATSLDAKVREFAYRALND